MTRLALWTLAITLGLAGWFAIIAELGWWAAALAYFYLLLIAAIASVGGINAAMLWLERRRRR